MERRFNDAIDLAERAGYRDIRDRLEAGLD